MGQGTPVRARSVVPRLCSCSTAMRAGMGGWGLPTMLVGAEDYSVSCTLTATEQCSSFATLPQMQPPRCENQQES